jgi:hypothetical protein
MLYRRAADPSRRRIVRAAAEETFFHGAKRSAKPTGLLRPCVDRRHVTRSLRCCRNEMFARVIWNSECGVLNSEVTSKFGITSALSMSVVTFNDKDVTCGDQTWEADYPVLAARQVEDCVCLILDYMSFPKHQQARNLRGYTSAGVLLWIAEHPTNETADCYVDFIDKPTLAASNLAGFACDLDATTGKLMTVTFTK